MYLGLFDCLSGRVTQKLLLSVDLIFLHKKCYTVARSTSKIPIWTILKKDFSSFGDMTKYAIKVCHDIKPLL